MKYTVEDYLLAKKLFGSGDKEVKRLPDGYQEVEYIESINDAGGANPFIDTCVIPKNTSGIGLEFTVTQFIAQPLMGSVVSATKGLRISFNGSPRVLNSLYWQTKVEDSGEYNVKRSVMLRNNITIIDGVTTPSPYVDFGGIRYPILIFNVHQNDSQYPVERTAMKCFSAYIFDSDTITANYIPCYRISDGTIGMYDLCGSICPLTGTPFYINAGTGTFTKGRDVRYVGEPPFIVPEYLGSTFKLGKSKLYG